MYNDADKREKVSTETKVEVVVAETPATTKVALLILLSVGGNKCSLDLEAQAVLKIFN